MALVNRDRAADLVNALDSWEMPHLLLSSPPSYVLLQSRFGMSYRSLRKLLWRALQAVTIQAVAVQAGFHYYSLALVSWLSASACGADSGHALLLERQSATL